jgi:hypothetical protein
MARKPSTPAPSPAKKARLAMAFSAERRAEIGVASSRRKTLMPRRLAAAIAHQWCQRA